MFLKFAQAPTASYHDDHDQKSKNGNQYAHGDVPSANRRRFEHIRWQMNAGNQQAFGKFWPHTRRNEFSDDLSVFLDAAFAEDEDVLHSYNVTFHASNLSYTNDFTRSIAVPADLNHNIDCRSNLTAYGAFGNIQVGHCDHGFEATQRISRRVRVNGCE